MKSKLNKRYSHRLATSLLRQGGGQHDMSTSSTLSSSNKSTKSLKRRACVLTNLDRFILNSNIAAFSNTGSIITNKDIISLSSSTIITDNSNNISNNNNSNETPHILFPKRYLENKDLEDFTMATTTTTLTPNNNSNNNNGNSHIFRSSYTNYNSDNDYGRYRVYDSISDEYPREYERNDEEVDDDDDDEEGIRYDEDIPQDPRVEALRSTILTGSGNLSKNKNKCCGGENDFCSPCYDALCGARRAYIPRAPIKTLSVPGLADDYYVSLLDWSPANVIAVGLPDSVALWNASTNASAHISLDSLSSSSSLITANSGSLSSSSSSLLSNTTSSSSSSLLSVAETSLAFNPQHPSILAIGASSGKVYLYDIERSQTNLQSQSKIQSNLQTSFSSYSSVVIDGSECCSERRIGVLSWSASTRSSSSSHIINSSNNSSILAAGGKSGTIYLYDPRVSAASATAMLVGAHSQEVCGLAWSPDGTLLASGGNDNRLAIWDIRRLGETAAAAPLADFGGHRAAVKAIAWSPHTRGRLVSGGGSSDRKLRFWDVGCGTPRMDGRPVDAGSQVCALYWSPRADEIVSTHGFSQNHTKVWNAPLRTPVAALGGHTARILYLAPSPDASTVVTAAPDGRMCFWKLYDDDVVRGCDDSHLGCQSQLASSSSTSMSSSSSSSSSSLSLSFR